VRLLNIPSEVKLGTAFEQHHGFADGGALADHIRAMAVTHFGHAGWAWLTRLTAIPFTL
jgi:putative DNA primase/helicase